MLRLLKKSFIILIYFVGVVLFVYSFYMVWFGFGFLPLSFFFGRTSLLYSKEDLIPGNVSKWAKIAVCNECKKGKRGFDFFCFN